MRQLNLEQKTTPRVQAVYHPTPKKCRSPLSPDVGDYKIGSIEMRNRRIEKMSHVQIRFAGKSYYFDKSDNSKLVGSVFDYV